MLAGLSNSEIISIIAGFFGLFLTLIGIIATLYTKTVEKTIKSQSELINQKIDLTHAIVMSNMMGIKEDGEEIRQIAITAHHAVDTHVLNYHRQG